MKKMLLPAIVLIALAVAMVGPATSGRVSLRPTVAAADMQETHLLRYPDISKDSVVFTYAGDLWLAPRTGGTARRLTASPGDEVYPKFSPDGKWIAFTAEYDGNQDVYVMPAIGGEPRRLTFHPSADIVLGWTPDSKKVLFRSNRLSDLPDYTRLFEVPVEGGPAEMLSVPRADLTSLSPDGQKIAYLPTSQEFRTWKRYRGGWAPPIGIYDLKNNTYEELPKTEGMDEFPMWHGNSIYFISDRDKSMNLYRYDLGTKKTDKLTNYTEYDIKWPSLGADSIVYENGGLLYTYDLKSGHIAHIAINVESDDIEARPEIISVEDQIRGWGISPTGVRGVFEARGDIFTLPVEHGSMRNLTSSPGIHELNPAWSPDGKWVAYLSDRSGEFEIYLRPQKGGDEVRVTTDGGVYRYGPVWSPDSKKLLYWDKTYRLWYVDIDQKQPVEIDRGTYDVLSDGAWSSDSKWVAYSKTLDNTSNALFLYSLDAKKVTQVTDGFYNDGNPVFDPEGKYLYFLSDRFYYPSSDHFEERFNYYVTTGVFAITLKKDTASPFAPQSDEEKEAATPKPEVKPETKPEEAPKPDASATPPATPPAAAPPKGPEEKEAAPKPPKPVEIDLDGIGGRIVQAPITPGILGHLDARGGNLFYLSATLESQQMGTPMPPGPANTLHVFDVEKREDKPLLERIEDYQLDKDGNKVMYKVGKAFGITDAIPGKAKVGDGRLETGQLQALVDPHAEWNEMFEEAWRTERDFYWDPAMGGIDWKKIHDRYAALLPWVAHRSDLTYIIGEMISELSTSHTYVEGGVLPEVHHVSVGLLGADYDADQGFYRFKKIYRGEDWNPQTRAPLAEPGLKIKEGDYLVAVNGVPVRSTAEIYSYFQSLANTFVTLKINDKPSDDGAWEINVRPIPSEGQLRYHAWVESRREYVEKATGGHIGYMHVPDTSTAGIIMFDKYLNAQIGKEGLIVDERYNHGGRVPDFYTEKLERHLLGFAAARETKDFQVPQQAVLGPKVMIVNEMAGSGGDMFPWFFQHEKIGPVVGKRTWGGLVGYRREIPFMDGGFVTVPEVAFWTPDNGGEWIVENHGVDPDYVVDQRPDLVAAGHDPQLEKAIELEMEALKTVKPVPPRPKYPKKN